MSIALDDLPRLVALAADHLWQSTLFAGAVWAVVLVARRASARTRYALWLVALAKFVVPSALVALAVARIVPDLFSAAARSVEATVSAAAASVVVAPAALAAARVEASSLAVFAAALLVAIWAAGAMVLLARWELGRRRFASVVATGRRETAGRVVDAVERARLLVGLTRMVDVVESGEVVEPGVWGVVRPVIVIPERLADRLTDEALDLVALHELAHVARNDNLAGHVLHAICCLVWFHPLVWSIDRRIRAEREGVCDELVLSHEADFDAYAATLVAVSKFCVGADGLVGRHAMAGSDLRRRIENIMAGDIRRRTLSERLATITVLAVLLAASVATSGSGVLAKERGDGDTRTNSKAAAADLVPLVHDESTKHAGGGQSGLWISVSAAAKRFDASTGLVAFTLTASDPSLLERVSEKSFEIVPVVATTTGVSKPFDEATKVGVAKGASFTDISTEFALPADANAIALRLKLGPDGKEAEFTLTIDAVESPQPATVTMGAAPEAP